MVIPTALASVINNDDPRSIPSGMLPGNLVPYHAPGGPSMPNFGYGNPPIPPYRFSQNLMGPYSPTTTMGPTLSIGPAGGTAMGPSHQPPATNEDVPGSLPPVNLEQLKGLYTMTPFGLCCVSCKTPVTHGRKSLTTHGKDCQQVEVAPAVGDRFKEYVQSFVDKYKKNPVHGYHQYIAKNHFGTVCGCGDAFLEGEKRKFQDHCRNSKKDSCKADLFLNKDLIYESVCGRIIAPSSLGKPEPHPVDMENCLEDILPDHEDAEMYVMELGGMFKDFDVKPGQDFNDCMSYMVGLCDPSPSPDKPIEAVVVTLAEKWLSVYSRKQVNDVPANIRAALQVFEGQDVGEVAQNYTFTMPLDLDKLLRELVQLVLFCIRHPTQAGQHVDVTDMYSIPRLLHKMCLQTTPNYSSHPVVVQFCLVRCFRVCKNKGLQMVSCQGSSSHCGRVMSLLRAAFCSVLVSIQEGVDDVARNLVQDIRNCRVFNKICPLIRKFREKQRKKPVKTLRTIDPQANICVDGLLFPASKWKQLVPLLCTFIDHKFAMLFFGDNWKKVLEQSNVLYPPKNGRGVHQFSSFLLNSLPFQADVNKEGLHFLHQLTSAFEMAFHGMGGGPMRFEETQKMLDTYVHWHRSTIYFIATCLKVYTYRSHAPDPFARKLPECIARRFLLYRYCWKQFYPSESQSCLLLIKPPPTPRHHKMPSVVQELFGHESPVNLRQLRQVYAGIQNITFPDGDSPVVAAEEESAALAGHSASTHKARYGSTVVGGPERIFNKYHQAIGCSEHNGLKSSGPLLQADLDRALVAIAGSNAEYSCDEQKTLVQKSSRNPEEMSNLLWKWNVVQENRLPTCYLLLLPS